MKKKAFKIALKDSFAVLPGYVVLGIGFGITLKNAGYGVLHCALMSIFIYAGSMQYVTISLLTSSASILSCIIMTIAVNIRHLFYGISVLNKYQKIKKYKIYDIFALTDETFSIVVDKDIEDDMKDDYYFFLSILNQSYWVLGSILGSLLKDLIHFNTNGVEFSMTALFICVVINQIKDKQYVTQSIGFLVSFLCLIVFGSSNFIIPSIVGIIICLLIMKAREKNNG